LFSINAWQTQVTVNPEAKRLLAISRETWNGLNLSTPVVCHKAPTSIFGDRLL